MQVVVTANLVMQIVLHWQKQKRPISAWPTTSHPPRNLTYELSHLNAVHDMRIWNEAATLFREVDICQLNDKNKRNTTVWTLPYTSSICNFRLWKHKTVQKKTTAYAGDSRNPMKFLSSTSTFQQLQNVVRNLVTKEDQQDYIHTDRQEKAPNVCCPVPLGQNDDGNICTPETLSCWFPGGGQGGTSKGHRIWTASNTEKGMMRSFYLGTVMLLPLFEKLIFPALRLQGCCPSAPQFLTPCALKQDPKLQHHY